MNITRNLLLLFVFGLACIASGQTRTMLKDASTNKLLEDFKTGAHTITISGAGTLLLNSSADTYKLTLAVPTLAADGVLTLPSATGTLIGTGDSGTVSSTMLAASGVTAGSYGSATQSLSLTVNAKGLVTSAAQQTVTPAESSITFTDITTNNASTTKHGYLPKLNNSFRSYMDGTGNWSTPGISINVTPTTSAASGDILTSDGSKVQKLTPGTGVSTALANAVNGSGGLLTYGIIGTSGAAVPLLNAANTFASGQVFGGSSGDYFALAASGTRALRLSSNGFGLGTASWLLGMYDSGVLQSPSSTTFYFEGTAAFRGDSLFYGDVYWNDGTAFNKPATDVIMLMDKYSSANACTLRVANIVSSSTSWEASVQDWKTEANVLRLGSDVGSGGGTARDVKLIRGGVVKVTLGANTTDHAQPVKLPSYTVAGLPSASTCGAGSMAFVTDSTSSTAYTTVSGGGSNQVLVISDGTNWVVH